MTGSVVADCTLRNGQQVCRALFGVGWHLLYCCLEVLDIANKHTRLLQTKLLVADARLELMSDLAAVVGKAIANGMAPTNSWWGSTRLGNWSIPLLTC